MNALEKSLSISICLVSLASAQKPACAQNGLDLPDAPSPVATVASSSLPTASDLFGRLPEEADPGQTGRPAVDNSTGAPQREATWRSLPGDFLHRSALELGPAAQGFGLLIVKTQGHGHDPEWYRL